MWCFRCRTRCIHVPSKANSRISRAAMLNSVDESDANRFWGNAQKLIGDIQFSRDVLLVELLNVDVLERHNPH